MNLIVSPATISDGTSNHIFTLQKQETVGKSVISTWKELAAAVAIASTIKSKYDDSNPYIVRAVAQFNNKYAIADGVTLKPATINISAVFHREHSIANLTLLGLLAKNATAQANFWSNFFNQM